MGFRSKAYRRARIRPLVGAFAVWAVCGAVLAAPSPTLAAAGRSDGIASVGAPTGMRLVFDDQFDGSALNTGSWGTCYPWSSATGCTNYGNKELEWYVPTQDHVSNGALHLVSEETATPGLNRYGQPKLYPWRSGIVTTYPSFQFTYGYVSVTARIPSGKGLWPALWLLPADFSWPPEIDAMEAWCQKTSTIYMTYHRTTADVPQYVLKAGIDMSAAWHTYAVDWEPTSLTWYVDGRQVYQVSGPTPAAPMYFLANLAIDGTRKRGADSTTPPTASFDIDHVEIYQW